MPTKVLEGQWGCDCSHLQRTLRDRGYVNTGSTENNIMWTLDCMVEQFAWEFRELQNLEQAVDMRVQVPAENRMSVGM